MTVPSDADTAPPDDTAPDPTTPATTPPIDTAETGTESPEDTGSTDVIDVPDGCRPGGEAFGVEGQLLTLSVQCTQDPVEATLSVADLPDGATWDDATQTLQWTPRVDQAGKYVVEVTAITAEGPEFGEAVVWVADNWRADDNVPVDPLVYEEEYGLPVVHLERPPSTNSSDYVDSTFVYRGHTFDIEVKYRGAASLGYPKNSYTVKFPSDDEFEDDDFDFPKRRRIVLTTTFDDNSYVRQRMCYDIWNLLDPTHHAVETMHAVVYINGNYEGLYLLGDHIDGEYWEDYGYWEDGNLYKAVNHDANFYGKSNLAAGYEKKEGLLMSGANAYLDLEEFVGFAAYSDDATFRKELATHIDVAEVHDWWALVRFTEAGDSAGKNSYLYNNPELPMWHYAPWDFNHSLGQSWQTLRIDAESGSEFTGSNNLFNRMLDDPLMAEPMLARWRSHLDGPIHVDAMLALLDDYYAEVDPSAARDWDKWASSYQSYSGWSWRSDWTTYEEEVVYLREWVADRWTYLDGLYPPP